MENKNKKPVNIIFIDVDTVLATHRVQFSKLTRGQLEDYDPVVVEFLDSVCAKYLCYLVITSRSRKQYSESCWFKSKMVQRNGNGLGDFLFPDDELWRTTTHTMECKALEIDDWFSQFEEKFGDNMYINTYAIIDDKTIGSISMHDKHFVYVKDGYDGMGCHEYRKLIKILDND